MPFPIFHNISQADIRFLNFFYKKIALKHIVIAYLISFSLALNKSFHLQTVKKWNIRFQVSFLSYDTIKIWKYLNQEVSVVWLQIKH